MQLSVTDIIQEAKAGAALVYCSASDLLHASLWSKLTCLNHPCCIVGSIVGSAFVPQPGYVAQAASTGIATVGGAGDENLQKAPASGITETEDDTTTAPVMDTTEYGNSTASQQTQAESQEHKQQLNSRSEIAPSAAEAAAPSEDIAPSPALGPIEAKAPAKSVTAVPGPAPTGER